MKGKYNMPTNNKKQVYIGLASAVAAAAAYGATQTIARSVVTGVASPAVSATWTIFFGVLFLFIMSIKNLKTDIKAPRSAFLMMALAGICSSFGVFFMFTALSKTPVTIASPIGAINPLIAMALTHLFLQKMERVTLRMVGGSILVLIGVTIVIIGRA
jgi:drug/metabolite transporter (DMT)-like permease